MERFPVTDYKSIIVVRDGALVAITLNRPEAANGLDMSMSAELAEIANELDGDPDVKAVLLTGAGRFFCGGGDVRAMYEYGDQVGIKIKQLADNLHRAISSFSRMSAPLIIAVNGVAAGAGFSLAAAGDMVIASDTAKFTMAYSKIGLSPDGSSTYFLPRLIGLRRTQELMFTNRLLTAQEALDWGVVNDVVPMEDLAARVKALTDQFLAGAKDSNANIKELLLQTFENSLETQMELEGRLIAKLALSDGGREGVAAFVGKRAPKFT